MARTNTGTAGSKSTHGGRARAKLKKAGYKLSKEPRGSIGKSGATYTVVSPDGEPLAKGVAWSKAVEIASKHHNANAD